MIVDPPSILLRVSHEPARCVVLRPSSFPARHASSSDCFSVGRDLSCDLIVLDAQVSRRHCDLVLLDRDLGLWAVRDLGSSNGTVVNDSRLPASATVRLLDGDEVKLGQRVSFKFSASRVDTDGVEARSVKPAAGEEDWKW